MLPVLFSLRTSTSGSSSSFTSPRMCTIALPSFWQPSHSKCENWKEGGRSLSVMQDGAIAHFPIDSMQTCKVPEDHVIKHACMLLNFEEIRHIFCGVFLDFKKGHSLEKKGADQNTRSKCAKQCPKIERNMSIFSPFFHVFIQHSIRTICSKKKNGIPFWVLALLPSSIKIELPHIH